MFSILSMALRISKICLVLIIVLKLSVSGHFSSGRSNSPSEDSTGDELQIGRKEKRRSLKKKITSPENISANLSDSEISSPMCKYGMPIVGPVSCLQPCKRNVFEVIL